MSQQNMAYTILITQLSYVQFSTPTVTTRILAPTEQNNTN